MHNIRNQELLDRMAVNLKKIRKKKGLTQEELAFRSGLALTQIARIETGRINTTVSTLYAITKTLDIPTDALFKE